MEEKGKRTIHQIMRALHRDIGYLAVGFAIIYSLSGILLIYRDTDFLKSEKQVEVKLDTNIPENDLGKALRMRELKVEKVEGDIVYFQNGTYNKTSGVANYKEKRLPGFLEKLNETHKTISKKIIHLFSTIFGAAMFFLAISAFWMFKPKTKMFRRGIILSGIGFLVAIAIFLLN